MSIHATVITMGVISAIAGTIIIYGKVAKSNQRIGDISFEITGNGAIIFGAFMLLVGVASIIYGFLPM